MFMPMVIGGNTFNNMSDVALSTFTEVDPSGYISVSGTQATFTNIPRNADAYLYGQYDGNLITGNFECLFEVRVSAADSAASVNICSFSNVVDTFDQMPDAVTANIQGSSGTQIMFYAMERDGSTQYNSGGYVGAEATTYYCKFTRDEAIGTYGTVYLYIASSAVNRTNGIWLNTQSLALHTSKKDYSVFMPLVNRNDGASPYLMSGYVDHVSASKT